VKLIALLYDKRLCPQCFDALGWVEGRASGMPASHLSFLQAECPSCHPTNSVIALKAVLRDCKMKMDSTININKPTATTRIMIYILFLDALELTMLYSLTKLWTKMAADCWRSVGHQENCDDSQSTLPKIHLTTQSKTGLWDVFPSITAQQSMQLCNI